MYDKFTAVGIAFASGVLGLLAVREPLSVILVVAAVFFSIIGFFSGSVMVPALVIWGLIDIPTKIEFYAGVSVSGLTTIALAVLGWIIYAVRSQTFRLTRLDILALLAFTMWGAISSVLWTNPTQEGLQGLAVMLAFCGLLLATAGERRCNVLAVETIHKSVVVMSLLAISTYFISNYFIPDPGILRVGPRTFSLFSLIGLSWLLARWRYGSQRSLLIAIVIIVSILFTLSRTASAIALFLVAFSQVRPGGLRGVVRFFGGLFLTVIIGYLAITQIPALRMRFFSGDVQQIGPVQINMMGRKAFWTATWESFLTSPWIGHGAGSSRTLLESMFPGKGSHPHQDYLRILHDFGVVGFTLWMLGFGLLICSCARSWKMAETNKQQDAWLHLAALLSLTAVAAGMLTDNPIVYSFVMAPLAIIVGTSVGATVQRDETASRKWAIGSFRPERSGVCANTDNWSNFGSNRGPAQSV